MLKIVNKLFDYAVNTLYPFTSHSRGRETLDLLLELQTRVDLTSSKRPAHRCLPNAITVLDVSTIEFFH